MKLSRTATPKSVAKYNMWIELTWMMGGGDAYVTTKVPFDNEDSMLKGYIAWKELAVNGTHNPYNLQNWIDENFDLVLDMGITDIESLKPHLDDGKTPFYALLECNVISDRIVADGYQYAFLDNIYMKAEDELNDYIFSLVIEDEDMVTVVIENVEPQHSRLLGLDSWKTVSFDIYEMNQAQYVELVSSLKGTLNEDTIYKERPNMDAFKFIENTIYYPDLAIAPYRMSVMVLDNE